MQQIAAAQSLSESGLQHHVTIMRWIMLSGFAVTGTARRQTVIDRVVQTRPAGSKSEARAGKMERQSSGCDYTSSEWRCTVAPVKHQ